MAGAAASERCSCFTIGMHSSRGLGGGGGGGGGGEQKHAQNL